MLHRILSLTAVGLVALAIGVTPAMAGEDDGDPTHAARHHDPGPRARPPPAPVPRAAAAPAPAPEKAPKAENSGGSNSSGSKSGQPASRRRAASPPSRSRPPRSRRVGSRQVPAGPRRRTPAACCRSGSVSSGSCWAPRARSRSAAATSPSDEQAPGSEALKRASPVDLAGGARCLAAGGDLSLRIRSSG